MKYIQFHFCKITLYTAHEVNLLMQRAPRGSSVPIIFPLKLQGYVILANLFFTSFKVTGSLLYLQNILFAFVQLFSASSTVSFIPVPGSGSLGPWTVLPKASCPQALPQASKTGEVCFLTQFLVYPVLPHWMCCYLHILKSNF